MRDNVWSKYNCLVNVSYIYMFRFMFSDTGIKDPSVKVCMAEQQPVEFCRVCTTCIVYHLNHKTSCIFIVWQQCGRLQPILSQLSKPTAVTSCQSRELFLINKKNESKNEDKSLMWVSSIIQQIEDACSVSFFILFRTQSTSLFVWHEAKKGEDQNSAGSFLLIYSDCLRLEDL